MNPATKRAWVVLSICVVFTTIFTVLWEHGFIPLQELEYFAQDHFTRKSRKTPMDDRLVLIGIDKPMYAPTDFSEEELQKEPVLRDMQKTFPW